MHTVLAKLSRRSHLEVVEDAVVEALRSNPDSNILPWLRVPDPATWPDRPLPYGRIVATFSDEQFQLSAESNLNIRVSVGIAYEDLREALDIGDLGIHSLEDAIYRTLLLDRNLNLNRGGDVPAVVQRLASFEPANYGSLVVGADLETIQGSSLSSDEARLTDPITSLAILEIPVNYEYIVQSTSRAIA